MQHLQACDVLGVVREGPPPLTDAKRREPIHLDIVMPLQSMDGRRKLRTLLAGLSTYQCCVLWQSVDRGQRLDRPNPMKCLDWSLRKA